MIAAEVAGIAAEFQAKAHGHPAPAADSGRDI